MKAKVAVQQLKQENKLYQSGSDNEDDADAQNNPTFDNMDDVGDIGDQNPYEEQDKERDQEQRSLIEKEILFQVQGVGSVKNVNKLDVYVKSEHCEVSLREIIKHIKSDSEKIPLVKNILGKWSFLQGDLLPLLVFHDRDKKLAFLTLMLLVQLTELPSEECE